MNQELAIFNGNIPELIEKMDRLMLKLEPIFLPNKLTNTEYFSDFDRSIQKEIVGIYIKRKIRKSCKQIHQQ